jgi:hypothetical protein
MLIRCSVWVVLLMLCITPKSYAQMPFYHYFDDTIRPGYRISGEFDSIDVKLSAYQSTMPTFWRPTLEPFDLTRTYLSVPIGTLPRRYSSIPHVGLQYSFGTKLSQQAGISYTQALTPNQFIQLNYTRNNSNGAIRNAAYERNHFELMHLLRRKRYASQIELLFDGNIRGANGGVLGDTVDATLPLEFSEVEKSDALITQRYFHADWKHFFSFTEDSLIKTGFYVAPHYRIENRLYQETGDIAALYGVVNIDSTETYDRWERSEIGGTAGYFFHTRQFSVNAGLKTTYWDYDNLSRHSDTTEVGIASDLVVDLFNAITLKANGFYTFVGAIGEKALTAKLLYNPSFATVSINFLFNQLFPRNYQRAYYSNTASYDWQQKTLITTSKLEARIVSRRSFLPVSGGISFTNVLNNPFFLNNTWNQDTLSNLSFLSADIRADLKWRKLFVQPALRYQSSTFDYVPAFQLSARIGFDGYLFKAKKLRATIGIEAGYCTSYGLLDYIPMMDAYVLQPGGPLRTYEAMPKLHVFTQLELGFFRWFIRVENLEQTFWSPTNQEALGYPVVPVQLRIGLSWDLFN